MAKQKKELWQKEEVLKRLMRIAEEARQATFVDKIDKNGLPTREYDVRCATVELKAVEYAVKLTGMTQQPEGPEEIRVTLSKEAEAFSL